MRALAVLVLSLATVTAAAGPPEHELRVAGAVTVAPGARASASLTIVPADGRTIDADAPLSLRLSGPEGLKLPRRRYSLADAADARAEAPRFDLALEGAAPGSYSLTVEVRFWLCAARTCRPVRDRVEIPVTVSSTSR